MINTYDEAVAWVHSRLQFGIKPGLERMEWLLERLNHPERRLRVVHIGGTNGKGSTTAFLQAILQASGFKTGTFTSPFITSFNERISVNGEPISDEEIVELVNIIKPLTEELEETSLGKLTEFEVITAMAFLYFAKMNPVDIVLLEVGLGGKLDSTNVVNPLLSIITNIGLDHTNILGTSLPEIATEKAGIIKNGVSVISGVKQPEAFAVIDGVAKEKNAPIYQLDREILVTDYEAVPTGEKFSIETPFMKIDNLVTSLIGKHQTENASLAIMAALFLKNFFAFDISNEDIVTGVKTTHWPGRFEIVSFEPLIVLDGAHNEQAINSLTTTISERFANKRVKVLFSALRDKDLAVMIQKLDSVADEITFVEFEHERAATADEMFKLSNSNGKRQHNDWRIGLKDELDGLATDEVLVITGSLYFISEVRECLNEVVK